MTTQINNSWLMRLAAVLAAGGLSLAITDTTAAKGGGGGNSSHSQHAVSSNQNSGNQHNGNLSSRQPAKKHDDSHSSRDRDKKHDGKGDKGEAREGKDHNGTRQTYNGCKKQNCAGDKTAIVVTDATGKVVYSISKSQLDAQHDVFSAQKVAGGVMLQVGDKRILVPGKSVTVKNEALSQYIADKGGLTQTIVRNKDGSISDVLTVAPLKGL
jgi:hypothetical protein